MTESLERPTVESPVGVTPTGETDDHAMRERSEAVIAEALSVIDQALPQMVGRELVSSGEVADLLLDLRTALTHSEPF